MKRIWALGNLPKGVANLAVVEASSNVLAKLHTGDLKETDDGKKALQDNMPQLWEMTSVEEIRTTVSGHAHEEITSQVLIDKENDRYYFAVIAIKGCSVMSAEADDFGVETTHHEIENGAIYFAEISWEQCKILMKEK